MRRSGQPCEQSLRQDPFELTKARNSPSTTFQSEPFEPFFFLASLNCIYDTVTPGLQESFRCSSQQETSTARPPFPWLFLASVLTIESSCSWLLQAEKLRTCKPGIGIELRKEASQLGSTFSFWITGAGSKLVIYTVRNVSCGWLAFEEQRRAAKYQVGVLASKSVFTGLGTMATVLDVLTSKFLRKLGHIIENEVVMTLSVNKDIKRLKNNLEHFSAVREDAEALAMEDRMVETWWKNMTNVMFDIDVIIDLVMVHSQKLLLPPRSVCCNQSMVSCFVKLPFDHRVARRIKDINEKLDEIKTNKEMFRVDRTIHQQSKVTVVDRYQTSGMDDLEVVGRDIKQAVDDMVQMIVSGCHENTSSVSGIQGMGGIGKTTLAQKIYNEQLLREKFQVQIWLCITQSYKETDLIKQTIRMAGGKCDQLGTKAELLPHLADTIKGRSVFLVLDDVWKSDVWIDLLLSPFMKARNFHVLVTTRDQDVLEGMNAIHTHRVRKMDDRDGLELLMKKSFQWPEMSELKNVGYEIVKKCGGLPLAIKVVAGVLSTKRTTAEWKSIRDSKWSIHGLPKEFGGPLYLSYTNLPPELKQCFLWCALLPPNFRIHRDAVAYWWVAEGFVGKEHELSVHETAEEYYHELLRRNLLQPVPKYVDKAFSTMHDLLRSLGQYLTKDHSQFMNAESNDAMSNLRRLCISNAVEEIPALEEHKCMRTLLLFDNKNFKSVHNDIFRKLQHIRVLILRGTSIQNIPESVGNLVLLRLLDLSHTEICKLPESTRNLISLEYLCLRGCYQLHSLPAGLMTLSNISFLELEQKALDHVPKGIAKFQHLYNLRGVFESETGFRLDELRCLPNIQRLWVDKLEKATPGGELVLKNTQKLRELGLQCTMGWSIHDRTHYEANEAEKIQQVCAMLVPSPSLEYIFLVGFPGTILPEWLLLEPELNMPSLCHMHLNECISFSELPPAGQMPQLQVLQINGADALKTIGTELLGKGVINAAAFFPKLELLNIMRMRSLKKWSLSTRDMWGENSQQFSLMPCLNRLFLLDCPKLRALPEDLYMIANLKRIHIESAHKIEEIVDLPAVVWLKVKNNAGLRRISNLCKMQDLLAQDCPELYQAENMCSLNRVYMVDCPHAQEFRNCLPEKEQGILVHVATDGHNIFPDESL